MKIVCISDTHLQHSGSNAKTFPMIPSGDVIVHAGDATWIGSDAELQKFADWYGSLPHKHKIMIAGNHDLGFERRPEEARKIMEDAGIIYLQDSEITIDNFTFYGSPWQPTFGQGWAFNLDRGAKQLEWKWDKIPGYTDVLITHGPPFGYSDQLSFCGTRVGDELLARAVDRVNPRLHVCGHIHSGYGVSNMRHEDDSVTKVVNAAICNEDYDPVHKPIVIEI